MKLSRVFAIVLTAFLVTSTFFVVSVSFVRADPVFKQVLGIVDPNSVTAVAAYDPAPADNGWTYFYIQNRTNEGTGTDPITQIGGFDVYDPEIYVNVSDWKVGDECINVVNRDYGTYGVDHAGYVAFMNTTLTPLVGTDIAPNTELLKIPTPTFGAMDVGYINVDWVGLSDPNGLIAGYTLYRSETNASDGDWILIGGDVTTPLTGMTFNDTSVTGGTDYYYSLKVVFTGYQNDNPGSIDNYECAYFGEGTPLVTAPISLFTVDYIAVEYADTTNVTTIDLDVGMTTVTVYAQGYNYTGGLVGAVVADWTVNPPGLGSCSPTPSSSTQFTADFTGGAATVTATYGSFTDDFIVNIAPPEIDYIVLEYASNSTEIMDMNWNVGDGLVIQAAGFNNTGPTRIGLQTVTWENITIDTGTGFFSLYSADISTFTGNWPGLIEIRGTYAPGVFDNFTLGLVWGIPPTVDAITITYSNGTEITDLTLDILQSMEVFAYGSNVTAGSLGPVEVDWTSETGGSVDVATGLSTNFTAGTAGGLVNITATYGSVTDDLGVTINPPTVDYINITDGPDGLDLISELIHVSGFIDVYASGYNNSGDTYVGLVVVTWTLNDTALGSLDPTTPADMTKFTGSGSEGFVMITADDGSGHTDTIEVELQTLTMDYILLTDTEGGTEIDTVTLDVGGTKMIYASGFNNTGGGTFTGLVVVDWTQAPNTIGDFSAASGSSVTFTAGMAGGDTSITGTDSVSTFDDSFLLTINAPTVDYVIIRNESDNGGIEVVSDTFKLVEGETVSQTYYCAGYNDTAGYVEDVAADWSFDTVVGTLVPAAGQLTLFTATTAGTATLTADSSGMTDTIEIIVQPADDTTAPAAPTGLTVTVGTTEKTLVLTWNANSEPDLAGYWIYTSDSATGTFTKLNSVLLTDTTYTHTGLEYETTYFYKISAEDNATNESPQSTAVSGTTAAEVIDDDDDDDDGDDGFPIVLLLLPLIIIIVLILLFLMMKKKKPEEAPPAEEEKELPPPPGGAEEVEEVEAVEEDEDVPPPEDEVEESEGEEALEEEEEKPPEE
jgi:hypothetical protein